jgi:hypothetical protein
VTDFGFHFTRAMSYQVGLLTAAWPESAEYVTPFFTVVVNTLGPHEATEWFEAARRAQRRVRAAEEARTYQLGFSVYLDNEIGDREPTLAQVAAWEALKAVQEIARRDSTADFDVFLDCAVQACQLGSRLDGPLVATTASA